jgi:ABC-2 type transport system ATP-binding protein
MAVRIADFRLEKESEALQLHPILEVNELRKEYQKVKAVNGVTFSVQPGVCFGLLGPNGAGKTTTVEMMEGVTAPTSGDVRFKGTQLNKSHREKIGIQFQATALQDFLTVQEVLSLFKSLYRKTLDLDVLKKRCALEDFWDRDTKKLSGGQRQRVLMAVALVNDPDVIFLDEPTTGLDPQARRNFWELIKDIKSQGKTVVLTTHYMEEAFELCDEIAIMDKGLIIAQGEPRKLLLQHFEDVLIQIPVVDFEKSTSPHVFEFVRREDQIEMKTRSVNETLQSLMNSGVSLSRMQLRSANLEDLFIALTGSQMRE